MKIQQDGFPGGKVFLSAGLAVSGMLLLPGHGNAQSVTLSDNGSTANVNLSGASAGMNSWSVPGLNQSQLNLQWFYYSVNGGGVQAINAIGTPSFSQSSANFLDVTYANAQLSIEIQYTLQGKGTGSADITESIMADNLSGTAFNLNLFEYSNFNLLQSGNNSVTVFSDPAGGGYNFVRQTSGSTAIQEGITSPDANFAEAGNATPTLTAVTSGSNLNNNLSAGPGNVAWAFEWDPNIGAGQEFDIFKDKSLSIAMVPEPSSVALMALALGACAWVRRRQSP